MAKTVASIEAQIAALMAEKKELEIAERKADKDALGVAESIIGKIVLRIVDADWKGDPTFYGLGSYIALVDPIRWEPVQDPKNRN